MQENLTQDQTKRAAKQSRKASLEQKFLDAWKRCFPQLPAPTLQYVFAPPRRWRWDFSWPDMKLAVEIDGGSFVGGRHGRGIGKEQDHEKQNAAVSLGWRVLRFGTLAMKDPDAAAEIVAEVMTNAKPA